jgi:hypothetical protein
MSNIDDLKARITEAAYANDLDQEGNIMRTPTVKIADLWGDVEDTRLTEVEYNRKAAGLPLEVGQQGALL